LTGRVSPAKPYFVVALCVVAVAVSAYDLFRLLTVPVDGFESMWLGFVLHGQPARLAAVAHVAVCLVGAWGLWRLRSWARIAAMGYLAYVLASFILWGVRGMHGDGVMVVMAWQMSVLPFATFCFMYLQRGAEHFR